MRGGSKSKLNDPDFAKMVAELYVSGVHRDEMAEELGCHRDTISVWIKDPRVQAHAKLIAIERVTRITRRIDSAIEARLAHVDNMDTELLLKVRKEYLERALKVGAGDDLDTAKITNELSEAIDQNPSLAEKLSELLGG